MDKKYDRRHSIQLLANTHRSVSVEECSKGCQAPELKEILDKKVKE